MGICPILSSQHTTCATSALGQSHRFCMSAVSYAIHNTRHYRAGLRPICLSPFCGRSANNGRSYRIPCILSSIDLATRDACAVNKDSADRLQQTCAEPCSRDARSLFCLIAFWRRFERDWRGGDRRPTERKIKAAACGAVGRRKSEEVSAACNEVHFWLAACDFPQAFASSWIPAPRPPVKP
jgi:hypothetical protein